MRRSREEWLDTTTVGGDLRARSVRGGAITVTAQALRFVLTLASTALLSRLLLPEAFGLVAMVAAVTGFVLVIRDLGLSVPTVQRAHVTQDQVSALFWINVAVSTLLALATAASGPLVAGFYGEPRLVAVTAALAAGFVFSGLTQQHQALLRRQMLFGTLARIDLASIAVGLVAAASAAMAGLGYWALVLREVVTAACNALLVWIACTWRPSLPRRAAGLAALVRFGGDLTGVNLLAWLMRNADQVLIGRFAGAPALGFYSRAFNLMTLPLVQINQPLQAVAVPALSRIASDPVRLRRVYLQLVDAVALVTMPALGFLVATSEDVVRVMLGPGWEESAHLFALLGAAGLLHPVTNTCSWLMTAEGRSPELLRVGVITAAGTIASFVAGLPWGAAGVAAGYAISGVVLRTPLQLWVASRSGVVGLSDLGGALLAPGVAALVSMGAARAVRQALELPPLASLLVCFAVAAPLALLVVAAFPGGRRALRHVRDLGASVRREGPEAGATA